MLLDEDFVELGTPEEARRVELLATNLRQLLWNHAVGGAACGLPQLEEGNAQVTQEGNVVGVRILLPANAVYSSTPPQFPQEGVYCFPSGNFVPTKDLGWQLKTNGSHHRMQNNARGRHVHLVCKLCGTSITAKIDSLITTLIVGEPADGSAKHEH